MQAVLPRQSENRTRPAARMARRPEMSRVARDSLLVAIGGQIERVLGILTALCLRWFLDPARLGVYSGLRLFLDNTNRSSLGVSLGAVQEIPILRARGEDAQARKIANVAHTVNTLTCLVYALGLVTFAVWRMRAAPLQPLIAEWTWGMIAVAGLALLKRHESFQIAVLRAHQEFELTTKVDLLEALVSIVAVGLGLLLAGFWGLLGAVAAIIMCKILYIYTYSSIRFQWAWDWRLAWMLMKRGLPVLANTAVFGCVVGVDRVLILNLVPEGEAALGLYSVALLGSSWCFDLSGRIVLVLYPYFQTIYGRGLARPVVVRRALGATLTQVPVLAALAFAVDQLGPPALKWILPRYEGGLAALRPLLLGMLLLGLAWPARQVLIAVNLPFRLLAATSLGAGLVAGLGYFGGIRGGMVGVAWGVAVGHLCVLVLTTWVAAVPECGWGVWLGTLGNLVGWILWFAALAWAGDQLLTDTTNLQGWAMRLGFVCVAVVPIGLSRQFKRRYAELT